MNVPAPVGEVPMPMVSAYGASKAALRLCSEVMRLELNSWGVRVATIQPTAFRTSTSAPWFKWEKSRGARQEVRND